MITIFNRVKVLTTMDPVQSNDAKQKLKSENIDFYSRIKNRNDIVRRQSGINASKSFMYGMPYNDFADNQSSIYYYLYVRKNDYSRAINILEI